MRHRLLITTFALTLLALAHAGSVTFTVSPRGLTTFVEQPIATVGSVEVAVGYDLRVDWRDGTRSAGTPVVTVGYYRPEWAAWVEVAWPSGPWPSFGERDAFRVGFTYRY
jgi:hypothetical protein